MKSSLLEAALALLVIGAPCAAVDNGPRAVPREGLCVTTGAIRPLPDGRLAIDEPKVRAVALSETPQAAEIRFRYLGPTSSTAALGSGELRRQIGLKLRAQDGCNLVYAMWRIEPESKLVISVKRNPGKRTHAECGTAGYTNVKAAKSRPAPTLTPGVPHTLRAELTERTLRVFVDGSLSWEGSLGNEILDFDGPVGLRTDNARLEFEFRVSGGAPGPMSRVPPAQRNCGSPQEGD